MATSLLILVGCGDFGTDSSNSPSNSPAPQSQIPTIGKAYYVDSAVKGVNYICGSQSGTTDVNGMFLFETDRDCTFSLGTILLRKVDSALLHDGENLYEVDSHIASVLQGLDIDHNLDNGIEVDQDIVSMLDIEYDIVPSTDSGMVLFEKKMQSEGAEVPTIKTSEKHVITTILSNNLYRVEDNKTQALSFKEDGVVLVKEDEKVVDNASYNIDSNNTVTLRDHDVLSVQTKKIQTGEQYIPMSHDKLWFSKRLADKSRVAQSQSGRVDNVQKIHPLNSNTRERYLDAINRARAKTQDCGKYGVLGPVDPLTWSSELYNAAVEHSVDMGKLDFFSHTGSGKDSDITAISLGLSGGSSSGERVRFNGYEYQEEGENIAAGIEDLDNVIKAWIDSDGHCVHLMSSSYSEVGLSLYVAKDTKHKYFWTQVFGSK